MMNQEDLLKKTGNILKELQEQFEFFSLDPRKLSELELELFLANANFLTDHIQILRKMANSRTPKILPEHTPVNNNEIQEPTPVKVYEDLFKPDNDAPTFEFIVNENLRDSAPELPDEPEAFEEEEAERPDEEESEVFDEEQIIEEQDQTIISESNPISQELPETVLQHDSGLQSTPEESGGNVDDDEVFFSEPDLEVVPEPDEDEIGPEPFLVSKEAEPVVPKNVISEPAPVIPPWAAEEPVSPKHQPTLNELLASQSTSAAAGSTKPAISDLKSAINLNAKLLFVKDLFDGYNLAYSEAIDIVNKMPDFKAADKFLQSNYAAKHNWAAKKSTVEQFYELLHQRFPK
jgi:hypothetical protein